MKIKFKLCITIFLIGTIISSVNGQIDKGKINDGSKIHSILSPGEMHQYQIELRKNRFVLLTLMQDGVDVIVTTFDSDGKEIEEFDSPNGKFGPEYFTIITSEKGVYKIDVRPFDENEPQGKYTLKLETNEKKAKTLEGKIDQIFSLWDKEDTPGAAISIVQDSDIIYRKGYGIANLEYDIPISPSTIFHIASVSKQFTAFAILLLATEGKLSLDDDIRNYLPEVPDFGKTITIRHLVHHISGLRDQWTLIAMAGGRLDDVITKEHIMKLVERQKDLNFEPGEEFLYCNTGFTLLAEIVERISGQTFADFTEDHIFNPLNMRNTLFYDDHEKIVKNRAYSYYSDKNRYKKSVLSYANVGATSLFTTVEDLSKWAINFENPIVGNEQIINQMNERGVLTNGDTIDYAFGQGVGKYKGLNRISHGGGDAGYRTYLARFPEQKFSVIVFSNDGGFGAGSMANKIADIYLETHFDSKSEELISDNVPESESNSVEIDTLNAYVGNYELQPGFIIEITLENDQLIAQATGQQSIDLAPISSVEFSLKDIDARVTFHWDENNDVNLLKLYQEGQIQDAPRLPPFDASTVNLTNYTGTFYSDELATSYAFFIENDTLVAKHSRLEDIILTPNKEHVFAGDKWFFSQVEFNKNENDFIDGCTVSSGRVRNLKFTKTE